MNSTPHQPRTLKIDSFSVQIQSQLGNFTDIDYFQVQILDPDRGSSQPALLRIGSLEGGLQRELQLRKQLGDHKMVSELLAVVTQEAMPSLEAEVTPQLFPVTASIPIDENPPSQTESEYLEEEYYEEKEIGFNPTGEKLFILSELPPENTTLENRLQASQSLEESLLLSTQLCQFCRFLEQRGWCLVSLFPAYIQVGTPMQFFDLTGAYSVGEPLSLGLIGDYCPPEIAYGHPLEGNMSTYVVGTLLYQALHQKLPPKLDTLTQVSDLTLSIHKIPRLYQILTIALSPIPEERFSLTQLLNLLVETRQSLRLPFIHWESFSRSTVGLSTHRLHNEDNYGVRYQPSSTSAPWVMGVVADGMGGMAQGEVASQLAVETVLQASPPVENAPASQRTEWLTHLVQQANEAVTNGVQEGGTTLSLVFAIGRELSLAHVGDSRIYLIRQGIICQLSEDHSLVAMLVAGGEITYEESLEHPDRNLLIRSLGSKPRLSDSYVHTLNRFGMDSLLLEDGDILLLCSDGVWDLVTSEELAIVFSRNVSLQIAVDETIQQVIEKGANDNATLLALKFCADSRSL